VLQPQMGTPMIHTKLKLEVMQHGAGLRTQGLRAPDTVLDPVLVADEFWMTQPVFGPHPHAGFSAVTYIFEDIETGF
jgi:redox-sensitive bicupin YhaK (pirin superfamily)